jgi:hypothetical protein
VAGRLGGWTEADRRTELDKAHAARDPSSYARFHLYGLSPVEYRKMGEAQDWRCAICRSEVPLEVDHGHESKRVRGLLCGHCNRAIGFLRDNPLIAKAAARYLAEHLAEDLR